MRAKIPRCIPANESRLAQKKIRKKKNKIRKGPAEETCSHEFLVDLLVLLSASIRLGFN